MKRLGIAALTTLAATIVAPASLQAQEKTLVIDKILMYHTPQSAGWCMFVEIEAESGSDDFKNRDNSGDDITIPLNIKLEGVKPGETIKFKVFLDDNFAQVESNAEDRSKAEFKATNRGQKIFRFDGPKGAGNYYPTAAETSDRVEWTYKLFWHLE